MDEFSVRTKIIVGGGLSELLKNAKRVFIVSDDFMVKSGMIAYVTDALADESTEHFIFSEVRADPSVEIVTKGVEQLLSFAPDVLVAFGGGSPIDAAKSILFFAEKRCGGTNIKFIAIPTTSGTGSEVSKFAVITDSEKAIKYPLADSSMLPDIAVLDPVLTTSIPPSVTADTGIDVFTHAIEAYVCTARTDFSDAAAEKSLRLVYTFLMDSYRQPDNLLAREKMHVASCLAGIAFSNSGLGLNHAMAHTLGAHFGIAHGRANGILLPYVMNYNAGCLDKLTETAERYAGITHVLGLDTASTRQSALTLIRTIKQFIEKLGMPSTIKAYGISQADFDAALPRMCADALADSCAATNPRPCDFETIEKIFRRAYSGRLL